MKRTIKWLLPLMMLLTACKQMEYVTVEKVRTDTTYITRQQRDSVWLHDSILITERGDTVKIEKWHTKYCERMVHDTTYIARTDSVPVPYEVVHEVPSELTAWQRIRLLLANIMLYSIALIAAGWLVKKKFCVRYLK